MWLSILCVFCLLQSIALIAAGALRVNKERKRNLLVLTQGDEKNHRSVLTLFQVFLIWYFFAVVTLYFPIYRVEYSGDAVILRGFKVVLLSVHNALRTFILDGDFNGFRDVVGSTVFVQRHIGQLYNAYAAVIFVVSPFLTAGFVLSFFKNIKALVRYTFSFNEEICYISELNEYSLALAENILTEKSEGDKFYLDEAPDMKGLAEIENAEVRGDIAAVLRSSKNSEITGEAVDDATEKKQCCFSRLFKKAVDAADKILTKKFASKTPLIIFFDVYETEDENNSELQERARRLKCIFFRNDMTDIGLKKGKNIKRKFYFVGKNDEENINQAITMINHCREADGGVYNRAETEFYVFSITRESEALLDMVDKGNMKVRRVNEKRNLVLNTVIDYPVFENYKLTPEGKKRVCALIIGAGSYGRELMKTLCWCGQMPDYEIAVHICDKEDGVEAKLENAFPELMRERLNSDKRKNKGENEPRYEIYVHKNIDAFGSSLRKLAEEIEMPTSVFVTLGTDEYNVEAAMKIRSLFEYRRKDTKEDKPKVYSVVYSAVKNQIFAKGLKVVGKSDYDITFIGNMKTRYSLKVIEQNMLDKIGMRVHLGWTLRCINSLIDTYSDALLALKRNPAGREEAEAVKDARVALEEGLGQIASEEDKYGKYEYFRRSSVANATHMIVMKKLGITFNDNEIAQINEHKRWCVFMRCEGYVYHTSGRDYVAKTHHNLEPYENLTPDDKIKDCIAVYKVLRMSEGCKSVDGEG